MTAETEAERHQRELEFRQRMRRDGDLGLHLCAYLWGELGTLHLGGEEFEITGDVPGYEDDNYAVLLRRKSDGQVFEVDIEVTIVPVTNLRQPAQVTPLCGPTS